VDPTFALLDDAEASAEHPSSRLYTGFVREHRCTDPATLDAVCAAVQAELAAGRHAVLLADYEWGAKLLRAGLGSLPADNRSALRVLVFRRLRRISSDEVAGWLAHKEGRAAPAAAGALDLQPEIARARFEADIARIHEAIRAGETYQVNYTYRLRGTAHGTPIALYRRLRARQRVAYGALIRLPMGEGDTVEWVLSRSPELFVRHEQGRLMARPMKGTAARASVAESDGETARLLHEDVKNRAENLMIVDLLRNDLGRIAELGSVEVPQLFHIEPYATVFQMTSTVMARRRPEVGLAGLLRALFPCGSITGAPKHRTMDWIAQLETSPRGLYTGAIGWLDAPADASQACPDLCMSVAIRTLVLGPERAGRRALTLGIGGGIVLDSVAGDEYEETRWKSRFLTALDPGVSVFETMLALPGQGVPRRAQHRARIAASAQALGFAFSPAAFDATLDRILARATAANEVPSRIRLTLSADGRIESAQAPLAPLDLTAEGRVRLRLAATPLPEARPLAGHKSTDRADYDQGIRDAEAAGAFDTLFFHADGTLVEGGRTNVFLKLGGRWFTPRLADGALPGVMRAELLADPAWQASERRLTRADLAAAEDIVVCNALRGALPATLD